MQMKFETVGIPTLLGIESTRRVSEGIREAMQAGGLRLVGVWDRETGFACVVEVAAAGPMLWHLAGPFTEDQAGQWLGIRQLDAEASFATIN